MSLTLLQLNQCHHQGCGLHFRDQYDLISHIEYVHLPIIEADKQRKSAASQSDESRTTQAAPNTPLSYVSRVFRNPKNVKPVPYEPFRISFNHYRKRPAASYPKKEKEEFEECPQNDSEVRYRCQVVDCTKRFKNSLGLKHHLRVEHGVETENGGGGEPSYPSSSSTSQQGFLTPNSGHLSPAVATPITSSSSITAMSSNPAPSPAKPHKCTHCAKRYKTATGLANHQFQAHQKSAGMASGPEPSGEDAAKLMMEIRHQRQQEAASALDRAGKEGHLASAQQAAAERRQHAAAFAAANSSHMYENGKNGVDMTTHLPVRSISVGNQQLRFTQNQANQSTGHVLAQQIQQQRKQAKLLQAQNAAIPPSTSAIGQNHQQVQQQQHHQQPS